MMKLKTIAIACMTASGVTGGAFAQDGLATGSFPTPSSSSSSAVSAPRTGLYSSVTKGNAAADNTVDDFTRRPTLIGDKQYFAGYGNDSLQSGAYSFQGIGFNWFGAMVGGANPDEVRVGVGSGTAWGGGLIVSFDKNTVETAAGKTKTVIEGDGFGAFGDFNLGTSDVYGQVALYTGFDALNPPTDHYTKVEPQTGPTVETTNSLINVMVGWKKDATTEHTHALNAEVTYNYSSNEVDPSTPTDKTTLNELIVALSHGYILKASTDYSVFLGVNGGLSWQSAKQETPDLDASHIGVFASPNLAFQKQLGKGFEGFSGGSVTLSYDTYSDMPVPFAAGAPTDATELLTAGADVAVGLRWVKDNFALEGGLKESVLANGPYIVGGNAGQGLFYNLGISLGI
jgi:hypothetical protein